MAKKKRRVGEKEAGCAVELAVAGDGGSLPTDEHVALLVRAVNQLVDIAASGRSAKLGDEGGSLREALLPLVSARAAKYEEDAKATKLAEVAAGTLGSFKAGVGGKKWPPPGVPLAAASGVAEGAGPPLTGEEMGSVVQAAASLAKNPEAMASKAFKPLRSALHPLVEGHLREEKSSPAFRITCALSQRTRWPDALRMLSEMRKLEPARRPKLGAYQRWVREIGAAEGDEEELAMLDAILRVAIGLGPGATASPSKGALDRIAPWHPSLPEEPAAPAAAAAARAPAVEGDEPVSTANRLANLIAARRGEAIATKATVFGPGSWSVIAHEKGADRQPPNRFDLGIYACRPGVATLTSPPSRQCQRHAAPGVAGAFVLTDILSPAECTVLRELTEAIGYRPDVPLSSPLDERAQNVVLFASEEQNDALFSRIHHLLPEEADGAKLHGLNRRWRVYRYDEGNLYRKHLDGAWPASGMRSVSDGRLEYAYDAFGNSTRSRYTFILYLNDVDEGGCTTFFVPKVGDEGVLESRPVQPRAGSATVFPHGETGILLHEGSCVAKGRKYLLRTEIVYTTGESSDAMKEARRLRGLARQLGGLGGKALLDEVIGDVPDGKAGAKKGKLSKTASKKAKFLEAKQKKTVDVVPRVGGDGGGASGVKKKTKKGQRVTPGAGKHGKKKPGGKKSGGKKSGGKK